MPTRAVFRCQFCDATPDHGTQRSLQGQVTERMFGEYLDAFPGRWLVWNGGGPLGPRRYACRKHRGDLVAYLRYHYATVAAQVWKMPPYEQRWPDEKRPHMGGSMGIIKFGLRGGLLQDAPREAPAEKEPPPTADIARRAAAAGGRTTPRCSRRASCSARGDGGRPAQDAELFPPGELFLPDDMLELGGPEPLEDPWPSDDEPWPGGPPPDDPWPPTSREPASPGAGPRLWLPGGSAVAVAVRRRGVRSAGPRAPARPPRRCRTRRTRSRSRATRCRGRPRRPGGRR